MRVLSVDHRLTATVGRELDLKTYGTTKSTPKIILTVTALFEGEGSIEYQAIVARKVMVLTLIVLDANLPVSNSEELDSWPIGGLERLQHDVNPLLATLNAHAMREVLHTRLELPLIHACEVASEALNADVEMMDATSRLKRALTPIYLGLPWSLTD